MQVDYGGMVEAKIGVCQQQHIVQESIVIRVGHDHVGEAGW